MRWTYDRKAIAHHKTIAPIIAVLPTGSRRNTRKCVTLRSIAAFILALRRCCFTLAVHSSHCRHLVATAIWSQQQRMITMRPSNVRIAFFSLH